MEEAVQNYSNDENILNRGSFLQKKMKEKNLIETAKMQGNVMVRNTCFVDFERSDLNDVFACKQSRLFKVLVSTCVFSV